MWGCRCGAETAGAKPSWTGRLLADPALLTSKIREEAGELCATWEQGEGPERAASEMADLLYHAMVLLNLQVGFWGLQGCWVWHGAGTGLCRNAPLQQRQSQHDQHQHPRRHAHSTPTGQGVPMERVLHVLRSRFGTSGVEEKAARKPKRADAKPLGHA